MALSGEYNGTINLPEAMNYYKKSADLGEPKGMSNYGFVLAEGYNAEINLREAMKLFYEISRFKRFRKNVEIYKEYLDAYLSSKYSMVLSIK
jgi:hypothetical protein